MQVHAMKKALWVPVMLAFFAGGPVVQAASVLMISVDGMKPEYVLEADAHALKIPFLRSMLRDGAFARGVNGVFPTVTYPSHTTLLTGVLPREHGIYNNLEFDPQRQHPDNWYWYAEQIRAPTLWHAAHAAGLSTASVGWPVSVGATDVDFLIPEYWRIFRPTAELNPSDRLLVAALSRPAGMLQEMQPRVGPYLMGNDTSIGADEIKTRFALDILRNHKPKFTTIHLSSLDDAEHEHGPFSAAANQVLETIDGQLARLYAAALANDPQAVAVVVSDHGFTPIAHRVNLFIPFIRANLLQTSIDVQTKAVKVISWKAQPWPAGGMAAVMLNPTAPANDDEIRRLLQSLQSDPANGIAEVLERDAIKARGGFPDAAFLVLMKPGYYAAGDPASDRLTEISGTHGSHGYSPDFPEMRSSLFISGVGVARNRDLGIVDMRQIAPTVAQLLKISMPSAKAAAVPLQP
jgi:predicted AlkP superfamily pyrophosphatase or phosphodiesterase